MQPGVLVRRARFDERHWQRHVHCGVLVPRGLRLCQRRHRCRHVRRISQDLQRGLFLHRGLRVRERRHGRCHVRRVSRVLQRGVLLQRGLRFAKSVLLWVLLPRRLRVLQRRYRSAHLHDGAKGVQRGLLLPHQLHFCNGRSILHRERVHRRHYVRLYCGVLLSRWFGDRLQLQLG